MIDLHTHTVYSDGTDRVVDILKAAQTLSLTHLSITDHNTVNAYYDEAFASFNQYYEGKVIKGVEITTTYKGEIIEILGYGFDLDKMKKALSEHVNTFEQKQLKEFDLIRKAYKKANFLLDIDALTFNPKKESSRKYFWKQIIKHPDNVARLSHPSSIESSSKFTRQEVYNPQSDYYVDQSSLYPSLKKTIEIIHESGGIAFLAHLHIYAHAKEMRASLFEIVKKYKLDGIECYYSTFTIEQMKDLETFCFEHNLLISGGSDYHGSKRPDIALCTGKNNLNITKDILSNWPILI